MTLARYVLDPVSGLSIIRGPDTPATTGAAAAIGSAYINDTNGTWNLKFGPADTDWSVVAATSGFLPLSGGTLSGSLTVNGTLVVQGSAAAFTNRPTVGGTSIMLVTDNAVSATKLITPQAINGVNFDGTAPITITAVTLSTPAQPNVTSLGTLTGLNVATQAVSGAAVAGAGGGWVSKDDGGTNRWAAGILGAVGFRDYQVYDIVNTRVGLVISATTGLVTIGNGLSVSGTFTGNLTGNLNGNLTGTVLTASQPNITSLGAITNLTANGAIVFTPTQLGVVGNGIKLRMTSVGIAYWDLGTITSSSSWSIGSDGLADILTLGYSGGMTVKGTVTAPAFAPSSQASFIAGSVHRRAGEGLIVAGIAGSTNDFTLYSPGGFDVLTIPTGTNTLLMPRSVWVGAGVSNGLQLSGVQTATGSIVAGSAVFTYGAGGGSLNLAGRTDGTPGYGVIISYWNGSVWSAALDVRNASGASTLNLMPAGGTVNLGAATTLSFNAAAFASQTGGTNFYHTLFDRSGDQALLMGGTADASNYYNNTQHFFRPRASGTVWMTVNASVVQMNVPLYTINDSQALTLKAATVSAPLYIAFQNSAATRRGYFGYGLGSSPNFYINNDEAGPIIFQPSSGTPMATFSSTSAIFTSRVEMGGAMMNLNTAFSATAGLQFYNSGYTAWQQYMAPGGATSRGALGNLTAPSGSYVTSYAMRSLVEPLSGYGWTWEAGAATGSYTPTVIMELTSTAWVSAGTVPMLKVWGDIMARRSATTGVVYFSDSISTYIYYNGSQFEFSGKPLTNIGNITASDFILA